MFDEMSMQLFEADTCTYTYLLADPETKDAVIIDPVIETVQRDLDVINDLELNLKYGSKSLCFSSPKKITKKS